MLSNILKLLNHLVTWIEKLGRGVEQKQTQAKADEIRINPNRSFIDKFVRPDSKKSNASKTDDSDTGRNK